MAPSPPSAVPVPVATASIISPKLSGRPPRDFSQDKENVQSMNVDKSLHPSPAASAPAGAEIQLAPSAPAPQSSETSSGTSSQSLPLPSSATFKSSSGLVVPRNRVKSNSSMGRATPPPLPLTESDGRVIRGKSFSTPTKKNINCSDATEADIMSTGRRRKKKLGGGGGMSSFLSGMLKRNGAKSKTNGASGVDLSNSYSSAGSGKGTPPPREISKQFGSPVPESPLQLLDELSGVFDGSLSTNGDNFPMGEQTASEDSLLELAVTYKSSSMKTNNHEASTDFHTACDENSYTGSYSAIDEEEIAPSCRSTPTKPQRRCSPSPSQRDIVDENRGQVSALHESLDDEYFLPNVSLVEPTDTPLRHLSMDNSALERTPIIENKRNASTVMSGMDSSAGGGVPRETIQSGNNEETSKRLTDIFKLPRENEDINFRKGDDCDESDWGLEASPSVKNEHTAGGDQTLVLSPVALSPLLDQSCDESKKRRRRVSIGIDEMRQEIRLEFKAKLEKTLSSERVLFTEELSKQRDQQTAEIEKMISREEENLLVIESEIKSKIETAVSMERKASMKVGTAEVERLKNLNQELLLSIPLEVEKALESERYKLQEELENEREKHAAVVEELEISRDEEIKIRSEKSSMLKKVAATILRAESNFAAERESLLASIEELKKSKQTDDDFVMRSKIEKALTEERAKTSEERAIEKDSHASELENLKILLIDKMQKHVELEQAKVSGIVSTEILKAESNFASERESFIAEISDLKNSKEKDAHDARSEILLKMENAGAAEKAKSQEELLKQNDSHALELENLKTHFSDEIRKALELGQSKAAETVASEVYDVESKFALERESYMVEIQDLKNFKENGVKDIVRSEVLSKVNKAIAEEKIKYEDLLGAEREYNATEVENLRKLHEQEMYKTIGSEVNCKVDDMIIQVAMRTEMSERNEAHTSEIESLTILHEEETRKKIEETIAAYQIEAQNTLEMEREAHSLRIKQLRTELEEDLGATFQKEYQSRVDEANAEARALHQNELEVEKKNYYVAMEKLNAQQKDEMCVAAESSKEELVKERETHASKMEELRVELEANLRKEIEYEYQSRIDEALAEAEATYTTKYEGEKKNHLSAIELLKFQHDKEMDIKSEVLSKVEEENSTERSKAQTEITQLKDLHAAELECLKNSLDAEIQSVRLTIESDLKIKVDEAISNARDAHKAELEEEKHNSVAVLEKLKVQHKEEMCRSIESEVKSKVEEAVASANAEAQTELASLKETHSTELEQLTLSRNEEVRSAIDLEIKAKIDEALVLERETAQEGLSKERETHATVLTQLEDAHAKEMTRTIQSVQIKVEESQKVMQSEFSLERDLLNSGIMQLKIQVSEERNLRETDEVDHNAVIDEMMRRLDDFEKDQNNKLEMSQNMISQKDAIISAVGSQLASAHNKISTFENLTRESEASMAVLRSELSDALHTTTVLGDNIERLKLDSEELKTIEQKKRAEAVEHMRLDMKNAAETQFSEANEHYVRLKSELESSRDEVMRLEKENLKTKASVTGFFSEIASLKATLARMESEKANHEVAAKSAGAEREEFQRQAQEVKKELKMSHSMFASLAAEKETLVKENQELKTISEELLLLVEGNDGGQ
mmetsp:Transcript_32063/g.63511  ORF Transcript_32063/g.63511 Transcript_32063/m.63511 type:complete len:1630 (-) Transcript_32063:285-5174(-)|eukprot:CAMPEP_0194330440 /NCGR_PEP_ID=MMETSP0171-20130528/52015_1 /TAXON_ID=218684 /ORGANISM="Corethron pennatum, Strain L29A3" /LENGTH=1629 /DNA_ID=CAMNT_0039091541 /DNA_START=216 /DNA_END=5105 /DNA_ORIENTATION=+